MITKDVFIKPTDGLPEPNREILFLTNLLGDWDAHYGCLEVKEDGPVFCEGYDEWLVEYVILWAYVEFPEIG